MSQTLSIGDPPISVLLKRSARARRLSLRVSRLDGRVTLSLPKFAKEAEAIAFLTEKQNWIRQHLANVRQVQQVTWGASLPYRGTTLSVEVGQGRRVALEGSILAVPGAEAQVGAKVQGFLKVDAQTRLRDASDRYAALLGVTYSKLTLRDTRSRWGSCTSDGGLMYSWRLAMAPDAVLDYVAAHEVCHLREMNHSAAFWNLVEDICPGFKPHRQWLRDNGDQLHAWQFKSD